MQVEEEEEAADEDSEDHDTYTIEEEPYIPRSRRRRFEPLAETAASGSSQPSRARKGKAGAPFQGRSSKWTANIVAMLLFCEKEQAVLRSIKHNILDRVYFTNTKCNTGNYYCF